MPTTQLPTTKELGDELVQHIVKQAHGIGVNSTNRLEVFLSLAHDTPPEIFWPAFQRVWSGCDNTWDQRKRLYDALTENSPSHPFLEGNDLAFWQALPDRVPVFRGGDWSHGLGLSWTTSKEVAESFARGHRGIRYSWPVVFEGSIRKQSILTVVTDRNEFEVIVRPKAVRRNQVHRWFEFAEAYGGADGNNTRPIEQPVTVPW